MNKATVYTTHVSYDSRHAYGYSAMHIMPLSNLSGLRRRSCLPHRTDGSSAPNSLENFRTWEITTASQKETRESNLVSRSFRCPFEPLGAFGHPPHTEQA